MLVHNYWLCTKLLVLVKCLPKLYLYLMVILKPCLSLSMNAYEFIFSVDQLESRSKTYFLLRVSLGLPLSVAF